MTDRLNLPLGAPGIYRHPETRLRELGGVRMDVCAFVGVAPRGPAREAVLDPMQRSGRSDPRIARNPRRTVPVVVESFDDYRRWFGGFNGPGLLPYAVAAFFENGGRRAYIARIVHRYGTEAEQDARLSKGTIGGARSTAGPLRVLARNEGRWGNRLRVTLDFQYQPLNTTAFGLSTVHVPEGEPLESGTLLRLTLAHGVQEFRAVTVLTTQPGSLTTQGFHVGTLASATSSVAVRAERVEAHLTIEDDDDPARTERYVGLGLDPLHSRWLGAALAYESRLIRPDGSWLEATIEPDLTALAEPFAGGADDYESITPDDFFDGTWNMGDDEPGEGVMALAGLSDLSLVVVPDLYSPGPLAPVLSPVEPGPTVSPFFERCTRPAAVVEVPEVQEADLTGLRLDPATDLSVIERWQARLVEFAAEQRSFVVLLDVPPRLSPRQILAWRARFHSAYAAAYHPWLKAVRTDDPRERPVEVPPSAVAAGMVAQREWVRGVSHGPANLLAAGIVDVVEEVSDGVHDVLHPQGINVYRRDRDGVRLTAARTLSRDATWRQLSVRRLVTMICRTLERQMQWAVFEPNGARLRSEVRRMVTGYLRQLFRAGAFRGATEEEGFFVRCDDALNTDRVVEAGQLITHIGVAPAEPVEFIVLRLLRDGDGTLILED